MPRVAQRRQHRSGCGPSTFGRGHVEGIGAHAEADQLGVDLRAARLRVLVLLEHQHAGALAQHEAVAVLVPGTADAVAGSSLRVDSARAAAKPPTPSGETVDSAPPAIITSASPYSIRRPASPMQCRPVVQAVTIARFGPLKPYLIDRWPEIMLMIEAGTKNGEMRRGPRSQQLVVRLLDQRQAADAGADDDSRCARPFSSARRRRQPGVAHRLDRRGQAVVDEGVHVARFLGRQVRRSTSKPFTSPANAAGEGRRHRSA